MVPCIGQSSTHVPSFHRIGISDRQVNAADAAGSRYTRKGTDAIGPTNRTIGLDDDLEFAVGFQEARRWMPTETTGPKQTGGVSFLPGPDLHATATVDGCVWHRGGQG